MAALQPLFKRLKEPSSYAALTGVLAMVGINVDEGMMQHIRHVHAHHPGRRLTSAGARAHSKHASLTLFARCMHSEAAACDQSSACRASSPLHSPAQNAPANASAAPMTSNTSTCPKKP